MRVLMSGGTGFVGRTFLDGLHPPRSGGMLHLTLLSRDPEAFAARYPECMHRPHVTIRLVRQTLPDVDLSESFDVVIHSAEVPVLSFNMKIAAQNDVALAAMLALAARARAKRFVYISSGAVYALEPNLEPPFEMQPDFPAASPAQGAYAWSKYQSEREVRRACKAAGISHVILRIFNVASRHVPLEGRYALGNFVRDLLDDVKPAIVINGSGRDLRSFIAGNHLAGLLWHSMQQAPDSTIYNACSPDAMSIYELAEMVCDVTGHQKAITVGAPKALVRHYTGVPNLPFAFLSRRDDIRREIADLLAARSRVAQLG